MPCEKSCDRIDTVDMSGVITDIKVEKSNNGRVKIYLDHQFAFTLKIFEAARLRKGQQIDPQQLDVLKEKSARDEAYRRALHYLSPRPRSRQEVARHLRNKGFPAGIVDPVIERLIAENLIDDAAFAHFWWNRRKQRKATALFRNELRKKGIEDPIISEVISRVDDAAEAKKIVDRQLRRRWAHLPPDDLKNKLVNYLRRRGYSFEIAFNAYRYACEILERDRTPIDPQ